MNRFFIEILMLAFCFCSLNAAETERELLTKAFEASRTASFSAVVERTGTSKTNRKATVLYQLWDQKNNFLYKRIDVIAPGSKDYKQPKVITESSRFNPSGRYICTKDKIIKLPSSSFNWMGIINLNQKLSFNSKPASYHDIACNEITVRFLTDKKIGKNTYLIGKDNNFIYAWKSYDRNGSFLDRFEFGKVNFNVKLTPAWFNVPENIKIVKRKAPSVSSGTSGPIVVELAKAMNKTRSTRFKAAFVQTIKGKSSNGFFYQLPDLKNVFLYQRWDIMGYNKSKSILKSIRLNQSGLYVCIGKIAIKQKWFVMPIPPKIYFEYEPSLSVSSKVNTYKNMPCVEYVVRFPETHTLPQNVGKDSWSYVRRYFVGKDNHFIYAWEEFSRNGKLLKKSEFIDIDFNAQITADYFDLPKGVKITDDPQRISKIIKESSRKNKK